MAPNTNICINFIILAFIFMTIDVACDDTSFKKNPNFISCMTDLEKYCAKKNPSFLFCVKGAFNTFRDDLQLRDHIKDYFKSIVYPSISPLAIAPPKEFCDNPRHHFIQMGTHERQFFDTFLVLNPVEFDEDANLVEICNNQLVNFTNAQNSSDVNIDIVWYAFHKTDMNLARYRNAFFEMLYINYIALMVFIKVKPLNLIEPQDYCKEYSIKEKNNPSKKQRTQNEVKRVLFK